MSEHDQFNWGTKAILEAPVRETEDCLIADVNKGSHRPLEYKLNRRSGDCWLNGHPFRDPTQMLSALARKVYLVEMQARRMHRQETTSTGHHGGWVPGTEYARMFIEGGDRGIIGMTFDRAGLGVHYERYVPHEENRPQAALNLDYELFVYFVEHSRPVGAPAIDDVILDVLEAEGVEGMANGRHVRRRAISATG